MHNLPNILSLHIITIILLTLFACTGHNTSSTPSELPNTTHKPEINPIIDDTQNAMACSQQRYRTLHSAIAHWCDSKGPLSCQPSDSLTCVELQKRADSAEACSDSHQNLNYECYKGANTAQVHAAQQAQQIFHTCQEALASKNC